MQGLLLNGHGTNPEDLDGVTYEKWTQSVKSAASALKETYGKVVLVGMSMGGLLALDCASTVPVDGVIVISTPIYLFDWRSHFLWLAEKVTRSIPKRPRHIDAPALSRDAPFRCPRIPAFAVDSQKAHPSSRDGSASYYSK